MENGKKKLIIFIIITTIILAVAGILFALFLPKLNNDKIYLKYATSNAINEELFKDSAVKVGDVIEMPSDFPMHSNKFFEGWYLDEDCEIKANFPITIEGNLTLYANYLNGNLPSENITYNPNSDSYVVCGTLQHDITTLVIPDAYNDGANGNKLLTSINNVSTDASLLTNNPYIADLYIGNNISIINEYFAYNCTHLSNIVFGLKVDEIKPNAFSKCNSLETTNISDEDSSKGWFVPVSDLVNLNASIMLYTEKTITLVDTVSNLQHIITAGYRTKLSEPPYAEYHNKRFSGWYYDSGLNNEVSFPMEVSDNVTLYSKYRLGNLPVANLSLSGNEYRVVGFISSYFSDSYLVIPDIYNNKPVTAIDYNTSNYGLFNPDYPVEECYKGLIYGTNIEEVYVGNNVKSIINLASVTSHFPRGSEDLKFVEYGRETISVSGYATAECINLRTVRFAKDIAEITTYYQSGLGIDVSAFEYLSLNSTKLTCYNDTTSYVLIDGRDIEDTRNESDWNNIVCISAGCFAYGDGYSTQTDDISTRLTYFAPPTRLNPCWQLAPDFFYNCVKLQEVVLPSTTSLIAREAFYNCVSLTSLDIRDNITVLEDSVFRNCRSLLNLSIGKGLSSIGIQVFFDCNSINSIVVDPDNTTYDSRDNCNALIYTSNNTLVLGCKSTIIPEDILTIGYGAFEGSIGLINIDIPYGVTTINGSVFSGCSGLKSISLPSSLQYIGASAFFDCSSLIEVSIPELVTKINQSTFNGCSSLVNINLPSSLSSIDANAFHDCEKLTSINIPSNVTKLGYGVFIGCSSLISLTFESPNGWTKASNSTFTKDVTNNISLTDPTQNATWFTETYKIYYWKQN